MGFSNSFSTQAINLENKFDSFKGLPSFIKWRKLWRFVLGLPVTSFDEEPVWRAGGQHWAEEEDLINDLADSDEENPFKNQS